MKTKRFQSFRTGALLLCAGLILHHAAPDARGQYGGLFVSATPQTPILLGQPLNIAVVVRNTTADVWEPGVDLDYSWVTMADNPSWLTTWTTLGFGSLAYVNPGATVNMTVTLLPAELPSSAGTYSVRLATAYNWLDLIYAMMDNSPKTVTFTITNVPPPPTNHAPVITPIGNQAVVETNRLSFTVTATDTDAPPQTLTFSLDLGAPTGAVINALSTTNARFTWTPPAGPAPRTNQITVRVTDNGSPPLSASNTFNVVVLKPPRFDSISRPTNGAVTLVWPAFPGKTYQVRYKDTLTPGAWTNLGAGILASNPVVSITNSIGPARQRFFRLLLMD